MMIKPRLFSVRERTMDHISSFLPVACAGFGLLLAGAADLFLMRKPVVVRVLASIGALGASIAAVYAFNQHDASTKTAAVFGVGFAACLVLRWAGLVHRMARIVESLSHPAAAASVMFAAGLAVVVGGIAYCDWMDRKAIHESSELMEMTQGRVNCVPSSTSSATTDCGTVIVLKEPQPCSYARDLDRVEESLLKSQRLLDQVIRRGPTSDRTNCHGWVFTGGRFHLTAEDVEVILRENAYLTVGKPQPGDLAIFRNANGISHSAIARYVAEGQPVIVEGKWGTLGVFLHPADKSAYGTDITYYRSNRTGHLLLGLAATGDVAPSPAPIRAD